MPNFLDSFRSGGTGRGAYTLEARSATEVPLTLTGAASQSANYLLIQDSSSTAILTINSSGNVTIANDLTVSGSTTISIDEAVTGNMTLTGNLTVNGNSTIGNASSDTLTVTATSTFSNAVTMDGVLTVNATTRFNVPTSATAYYMRRQTPAPSVNNDNGAIYTSTGDSGTTELFYLDAAGNSVQLTDAGAIAGGAHFDDDENLTFGNTSASPDFTIDWETADADAHYVNFAVSSASRNIIISEDRNIDWTHAAQTNPTLWIQSADSGTVAQYLSFAHDQTNAVITSGTGAVVVNATALLPDANDAYALGASGTAYSDLFLASGSVINFFAGDVTITHSAGALTFGGDGTVGIDFNNHEMTNVDIDSGAIDGTTIGGAAAGAITGTTIDATTDFTIGGLVITDGTLTDDAMVLTQSAGSTGATGFTFNIGAHTAITAATERRGINVPAVTKTWAAGAGPLAAQREVAFLAPTYVGDAGGALTITDSATVYIDNSPTQGANITLSGRYAFWVDDGAVRLDGSVSIGNAVPAGLAPDNWLDVSSPGAVAVTANTDGAIVRVDGVLLESASGGTTHAVMAALRVNTLTVTAAAADTTDAASFYVEGAATGGTTNHALFVAAGQSTFGGNIVTQANADLDMSLGGRLFGGGVQMNSQTLAANTNLTMDENDSQVLVTLGSSSDNTITLPAAAGNEGMVIHVFVSDGAGTNNAVVTRAGTDTISNGSADTGNTTITLGDTGDFVVLMCVNNTGDEWNIIHESGTAVA